MKAECREMNRAECREAKECRNVVIALYAWLPQDFDDSRSLGASGGWNFVCVSRAYEVDGHSSGEGSSANSDYR